MCINKSALLALLAMPLLSLFAWAGNKNASAGFVDINVYGYLSDIDADSVVTINTAASLPNRFSYFSLTNLINQPNSDELTDSTAYYTEQNIRWQLSSESPLDLTAQFNFRTGQDNDRHRIGARWRLNDTAWLKKFFSNIYLNWAINFHAYQWDSEPGYVWQIEHTYRMTFPYINNRIYLAGFIDHTFNQDLPDDFPASPVVWETQVGFEILDNFYAIMEYRVNQYNRKDVNNLALGVEYLIKW